MAPDNESISDLIRTERSNLQLREDQQKGVYVEGLSEWVVRSAEELERLAQRGAEARDTARTAMNATSSRSHACMTIIVERGQQLLPDTRGVGSGGGEPGRRVVCGRLTLVDLAGSERLRAHGSGDASSQRFREGQQINT